jgi:L-aspartate oxidase
MNSLISRAVMNSNITVYENHMAIDLITVSSTTPQPPDRADKENLHAPSSFDTASDTCIGAYVMDAKGSRVVTFAAKSVFLSTGGSSRVYLYTSNTDTATGDGVAMYLRLGYPAVNTELTQFHPTCVWNPNPKNPDQRRFLVPEYIRNEKIGGILTLHADDTDDFIKTLGYDSILGSRSSQALCAEAVDAEMKTHALQYIFLNATTKVTGKSAEFLQRTFPTVDDYCHQCGIDFTKEPIPVVPAAHYTHGGIAVDENGCTAVRNLYAVGETATTASHGSRNLTEVDILGEAASDGIKAASHMIDRLPLLTSVNQIPEWQVGSAVVSQDEIQVAHHWQEVRRIMWNLVGITRTSERLLMAKRRLELIQEEVVRYYHLYIVTPDLLELRNIALIAAVMIASALRRTGAIEERQPRPMSPSRRIR